MKSTVLFSRYNPAADLAVVSICLVMLVLMFFSYITRSRSYRVFVSLVFLLIAAALSNVSLYSLAGSGTHASIVMSHVLRCCFHTLLLMVFTHFVIYIAAVTCLERKKRLPYIALAVGIMLTVVVLDILSAARGTYMRVTPEGLEYEAQYQFMLGYLAYLALIIALLIRVRTRLYKRVMLGFYGTMALSFLLLFIQGVCNQSSFTVITFLFPILGMFYIIHSNPYNAGLGSIDSSAMEDMVRFNHERNRDFVFLSLYMRRFDEEGVALPEEFKALVRRFSCDFFRGGVLFQVGKAHEILLFEKRRNPDYEQRIRRIQAAFGKEYQRLQYDYKIVIGESVPDISERNEYVSFIRDIHRTMEENTTHRVTAEDIKNFNYNERVLRELADIYEKRNLDDPRVLVYCQPVYNINTRCYDTAEALMRLQLEGLGLVFPDRFISLAEEHGYIHVLTEIILHKTCRQIKALLQESLRFSRISVNVSVLELKDDNFCRDILQIIENNGVSAGKVAIELTESRSDSDFMLMQSKIMELKAHGITFYLDDFGTGYSSMERILSLPFDIIKFDRSMVLASHVNNRSEKVVESMAGIFSDLHYSVLYEGVETESDETMCRGMHASYLQGYKYSRPMPIDRLTKFFERNIPA